MAQVSGSVELSFIEKGKAEARHPEFSADILRVRHLVNVQMEVSAGNRESGVQRTGPNIIYNRKKNFKIK